MYEGPRVYVHTRLGGTWGTIDLLDTSSCQTLQHICDLNANEAEGERGTTDPDS